MSSFTKTMIADVFGDDNTEKISSKLEKPRKSNHHMVIRYSPKGIVRELQITAHKQYVAMCDGIGVEPTPKFTRPPTSKAKLCGSKAYRAKWHKMHSVNVDRRSQLMDDEDDMCNNRVYNIPNAPIIIKSRRCAVSDQPCAPLIPGSVFPNKLSLPRKSFRDALVW